MILGWFCLGLKVLGVVYRPEWSSSPLLWKTESYIFPHNRASNQLESIVKYYNKSRGQWPQSQERQIQCSLSCASGNYGWNCSPYEALRNCVQEWRVILLTAGKQDSQNATPMEQKRICSGNNAHSNQNIQQNYEKLCSSSLIRNCKYCCLDYTGRLPGKP